MLAKSQNHEDVGPISVTIFGLEDARPPADLAQRLGREVIEVRATTTRPPLGDPPGSTVALVYLAAGTSEETMREVVRWAERARTPVALIGCCTGGSVRDTEAALAAGFDDFVVARISARELAGRIRALARRVRAPVARANDSARFGDVRLDLARHQLMIGARRLTLTRTEILVMQALVAAKGRAISRAEILDAAWGDESFEIGERAVDNVVMRLRRKLGDDDVIVTVRGIGFRLAER